ncbi:T9SS type A sorting domain-containing protein [Calditrichota bacterium]
MNPPRAYSLLLSLLLSISTHTFAEYEPPEILIKFSTEEFGNAFPFCNVGDQNDDGYEDLMFKEGGDSRRVLVFYGSTDMDTVPDLTFPKPLAGESYGSRMTYFGKLSDQHEGCFGWNRSIEGELSPMEICFGKMELDSVIDISFVTDTLIYGVGLGRMTNVYDLNDDGYNDIVVRRRTIYQESLAILLGGEDFDMEIDWEYVGNATDVPRISGGYDINADGYQDVLVKTTDYTLFLGGEEISEEPYLHYTTTPYPDSEEHSLKRFDDSFTLVQDMNGDGYDDWVHHWYRIDRDEDGMMLFFGSDEPDLEPDLMLEGHYIWDDHDAEVYGGDFNGDGYGDIVSSSLQRQHDSSQMNFFFGSAEMNGDADLTFDGWEYYELFDFGKPIGAIGDYNGDGSDDIPVVVGGEYQLVILSGWKNASVKADPLPTEYDLSLSAYPNPFNSSIDLTFTLKTSSQATLTIFDTNGRLLETLFAGKLSAGHHRQSWRADRSGVYFVRLESGGDQAFRKIVVLK